MGMLLNTKDIGIVVQITHITTALCCLLFSNFY